MRNECSIRARTFYANFCFEFSPPDAGADLVVTVGLRGRADPVATSTLAHMAAQDILRLANYFDEHVKLVAKNPDAQSDVYVPLELNFQLQALEGEVRGESEGEFTLRIMANVADPSHEGGSSYVGCEGIVDLSEAQQFSAELRAIVSHLDPKVTH